MSKQARPTSSPLSQPPAGKGPPGKDGKKSSGIESGKLAPRIVNRRAWFDYHILDKLECGIALVGSEVKSVRQGKVQLGQSFARIRNGQVWLFGCHIDEYTEANQLNHEPVRERRLLLHRREIRRLTQRMQKEQGSTLIPLEIYFRRGYAKVLLGLGKGKKLFDKRETIKQRDDKRSMEKALRRR
jgi:SsrA-binding protein